MPLIIALAISAIVLSGSSARADNFYFSFTNAYGNVNGTVTGEVFGLTNSSTYQFSSATEVLITSVTTIYPNYPPGFTPTYPIYTFLSPWTVLLNSFIEDNGAVVYSELNVALPTEFTYTQLELYDYPSLTWSYCPDNEPFCTSDTVPPGAYLVAGYNDITFTAAAPGPPPPPPGSSPPPSPIPEPGTLALFGSGIFGLAGAVRRRMSK
jgi:hypothetical protein